MKNRRKNNYRNATYKLSSNCYIWVDWEGIIREAHEKGGLRKKQIQSYVKINRASNINCLIISSNYYLSGSRLSQNSNMNWFFFGGIVIGRSSATGSSWHQTMDVEWGEELVQRKSVQVSVWRKRECNRCFVEQFIQRIIGSFSSTLFAHKVNYSAS